MKAALLGPQRFDPNVAQAAAALGLTGPYALVTAGWQEREPEDDELAAHLGGQTVNLELHRRADEVFAAHTEFHSAYRARQLRYRQLQDIYRIRLEHLIESARLIAHRQAPRELLEEENASSLNAIRVLDRHHQRMCERIRREFIAEWDPAERPEVARHREEVAELLDGCTALAIAGGHVASLLNRLHLFGVADALGDRAVLAWSAGAMALTEQVVLFHDDPPQGVDAPQILDVGLSLVEDVVALPGPEERLTLGDQERMAMYAGRFTPRRCWVLPRRSWVALDDGEPVDCEGVLELGLDGKATPLEVRA